MPSEGTEDIPQKVQRIPLRRYRGYSSEGTEDIPQKVQRIFLRRYRGYPSEGTEDIPQKVQRIPLRRYRGDNRYTRMIDTIGVRYGLHPTPKEAS